jgi:hypothetical protein
MVTRLVEGKLTIEKKTPKIEPPTRREGLVYNGRYQRLIELGSSDSGQLHYSLDKEEWGVKAPRAKDAGTHTVYYKTFGDDNHKDSETGELKVTIAPKPLSVRAHRLMKYAGDPDPKLTYDWDNLEYGDALTGALTRDKGEMPGTYPIRLGTLSAGSNYKIEYVGEVLVILPNPKAEPRIQPTVKPTEKPTATPTAKPTTKPTVKPTVKPTTNPPDTPIVKPTVRPTAKPTQKVTE